MKKWIAVVLVGLIVLGLALVLGGGIYKTVNAGNSAAYVVNRYTGKTWFIYPTGKREILSEKRTEKR